MGFGLVASGRMDLAVATGLDPYDYGAAAAIIEAAGGVATDWNGQPLTLASGSAKVLVAGDRALIEPACRVLRGEA